MKALIKDLLPSVDELVALLEYYDNATYRAAVINLVETLQANGLRGFEDQKEIFDPERHELFESHYSSSYDMPTVTHCHLRGYEIDGETIRKAIVDVHFPEEARDAIVDMVIEHED